VNHLSELLRQSCQAGGMDGCPIARRRHKELLLKRSAAYGALSSHLRSIPAAQVRRQLALRYI
jgi:hypothetical protein